MLDRLSQLYFKLGLNKDNGLFFLVEADQWLHKFPYRISRILKDVIKPIAFFCIYSGDSQEAETSEHPIPFNQSFLFFFDKPSIEQEKLIHKQLINFGLAQAIFINREDTIDLFHGNEFSIKGIQKSLEKISSNSALDEFSDFSFINQLRGEVLRKLGKKEKQIDKFLLENITDARRILIASNGLNLVPKAANRLIGRLLFISYLIDRDVTFSDQSYIVGDNKLERKSSFRNLLLDKPTLYGLFNYITAKYNGDMFPLSEVYENSIIYDEISLVQSNHLELLYHLFNSSSFFTGGKYGNYTVQRSLFDLYDFEIIPVELISSIYENFIGNTEENEGVNLSKQKDIKAYYTPSYLVDYVLSQTVSPFLANPSKSESNCRVLDPACGSGIFLVETLRKIIEKELSLVNNERISDDRLWTLVKSNIFGIDIDPDAIDISIFSLYVTILDYKQPAEIENFKFNKLRGDNLFGGQEADFFNQDHVFNNKLYDLDFIIGNPPWGKVSKSRYLDYIKERNKIENKGKVNKLPVLIGDKEICQAFLLRTSDFASNNKDLVCSFVVSSKVLYNSDSYSKAFRNYFLQKFHVKQVVELSPVNNKIRGGNHVFENARYPAAVVTFVPEKDNRTTLDNIIQHITVRPNIFFLFHKTIVIEKHDVKRIKQAYFVEDYGGFDWLWKTLVFGNALDIHFIKRLKDVRKFKPVKDYIDELGYDWKGGIKVVDGEKKFDTAEIIEYPYLDAEKEFRPYIALAHKKWANEIEAKRIVGGKVGYIPKIKYFNGNKILFKKGVVLKPKEGEHHFGSVTAFNSGDICFSSTVGSLISIEYRSNDEVEIFLNTLVALFNSKLFTYFALNTGSSLGIEKSRINFDEFMSFPAQIVDDRLAMLAKSIVNELDDKEKIIAVKKNIEKTIKELYNLSEIEEALIDYSTNISIPILLRERNSIILASLNFVKVADYDYIINYIKLFCSSFKVRFDRINKSLKGVVVYSEYFLRINFELISNTETSEEVKITKTTNDNLDGIMGDLGIYQVCKKMYVQQDIRGFTNSSFYVIKPNERKLWHKAVAYLDAMEFEEELVKAEITYHNSKANARD